MNDSTLEVFKSKYFDEINTEIGELIKLNGVKPTSLQISETVQKDLLTHFGLIEDSTKRLAEFNGIPLSTSNDPLLIWKLA